MHQHEVMVCFLLPQGDSSAHFIYFTLTCKIELLSAVSGINRTVAHKQAPLCCQCMATWIPGTSHYMQNKHFQKE